MKRRADDSQSQKHETKNNNGHGAGPVFLSGGTTRRAGNGAHDGHGKGVAKRSKTNGMS
jgi:hypothetical protein